MELPTVLPLSQMFPRVNIGVACSAFSTKYQVIYWNNATLLNIYIGLAVWGNQTELNVFLGFSTEHIMTVTGESYFPR